MTSLHSYLTFNGNTEEAFTFYQSVFGGEFLVLQRFKDTGDTSKLSAADQEKIMHVSLPIGQHSLLMGSDVLESMGYSFKMGNNFSLSINAENEAEADQLYQGLSAGGKEDMPMQKTFWGAYFGMLTDKFGIQWMINFDYEPHQ